MKIPICFNCDQKPAAEGATLAGLHLTIFCEACVGKLNDAERRSPVLAEFLPGFLRKN